MRVICGGERIEAKRRAKAAAKVMVGEDQNL